MAGIFSDASGGILGGADPMTLGLRAAAGKGVGASGPSVGVPVSLGQVIGRAGGAGVGTYSSALEAQRKAAQTQAMIDMERQRSLLMEQQIKQAQQKDAMLQSLLTGQPMPGPSGSVPSAPSGQGMPMGQPGPQNAPMPPQAPPAGAPGVPGFLMNPSSALAAQALGLPGSVDLYKHLSDPGKREPGTTYIDRVTGQERYFPKLDTGMAPGPNGSIALAPGALDAINAIEGAKEAAKAKLDPYKIEGTTPGQNPTITNRLAVTQGGSTPPVPPAMVSSKTQAALTMLADEVQAQLKVANDPKEDHGRRQLAENLANRAAIEYQKLGGSPTNFGGIPSGLSENQKATVEGSKQAATQFISEMKDNYTRLRDVPAQISTLDKVKGLIPEAKGFMGPLGETKMEVAKFLKSNVPGFENFQVSKIESAEQVRTGIFTQIMDNLKKMDASPSQMQQKMMMDALGKLGTDPDALPKVLDIMQEVMVNKVTLHNQTVKDAETRGTQFPYNVSIDVNAFRNQPTTQSTGGLPKTPAAPKARKYNPATGKIE